MRIASFAGTGVAGLGLLVAVASSNATNASPSRGLALPAQRLHAAAVRQPWLRPLPDAQTASCNSDAASSFVGITGKKNFAGGTNSAVLGGTENTACAMDAGIGTGESNDATGTDSYIGAGNTNAASQTDAFVGGGYSNTSSAENAFVGGGAENGAASGNAFIGAGEGNLSSGSDSFIGAGFTNIALANYSVIGGGDANKITAPATYAVIGSGNTNTASGEYAIVLGGYGNAATGSYAVVAGGDANGANGTLSFAAGYHAEAAHNGSFVWSDFSSGSANIKDSAANQFVARSSGGVYLYSNETATTGVALTPGSGTWASLSDRNAKASVVPLDDASILAKVATLPIEGWRYKSESGVRHVGPMAQDFYAAFGVGIDDRHITSIDEDGVALAAIKGLDRSLERLRLEEQRKDGRIVRLSEENARLQSRLAALEAKVDAIASSRASRIRAVAPTKTRGSART
jgi:trimeric autotransporter adhesin